MAILLFLLLAGVVGCSEYSTDPAIRMGLGSAPVNLDPRYATDAASARANRLLYRRLVEFDQADRPVPGLADWERLAGDHYRFRLLDDAQGRRFVHGRRLTSEDVRATLASILDPDSASPLRTQLAPVVGMEVVDAERIDFFLSRPDPLFPALLAIEILPADLLEQGHPFHREPVGSGPFQIAAWPQPGRLGLRRRRDGYPVELVEVKDPGVRVLKLLRGEIDLLQNDLPPELFGLLRERPEIRVRRRHGSNFTYIGLNLEDPHLGRPAVRQAIAHAIDRQAIIRYVLHGAARPAQSLLPPAHWAGADDLPVLVHDPAAARRLLARAGYGENRPLELEYKTSTDPFRVRLATIVQAQLAEVGIRVKVRSLDWGTFFGDIKSGRFQMYSLTWVGIKTPDHFRYVFHSTSTPPVGANRGRYRSDEADGLIARAEGLPERRAQARAFRDLQALLLRDLPYVPLWYEDQVVALGPGVRDYTLAADGNYDGLAEVRPAERGDHSGG
jgi:peptide/nickel transport system substrate-binding protein